MPAPAPPPPPPSPASGTTLDPSNICVLKPLGKGATGTVLLVHDSLSDPSAASPFALKLLQNPSSLSSSSARHRLLHEASVLSHLTARPHPFLPSLVGGCNCLLVRDDLVAFALPYCPGGDLHVLRGQLPDRVFSPSSLRFYLSEIVSALRHLHSLGLAFRDLKPENILIQCSGHLMLADFDLSKHLPPPLSHTAASPRPWSNSKPKQLPKPGLSLRKVKSSIARVSPVSRRRQSLSGKSYSFVGTEEYVAPEVIRGDGHGFAVDWWALGVLAYEMSFGKTPFKGRNRKETFRNVLAKPVQCPGRRTTALTNLIEQLLAKDPSERLGYSRGAEEIMEHEFFHGVRWDVLAEIARPPFIPPSIDTDTKETTQGMDLMEYLRKSREPRPASRCCSFRDSDSRLTES